jgi:hypothetical protein
VVDYLSGPLGDPGQEPGIGVGVEDAFAGGGDSIRLGMARLLSAAV